MTAFEVSCVLAGMLTLRHAHLGTMTLCMCCACQIVDVVPMYQLRPPFVSRGFVMSSTVLDTDPTALLLSVVVSLDSYINPVRQKSPDVVVRVTDHTGQNPHEVGSCSMDDVRVI